MKGDICNMPGSVGPDHEIFKEWEAFENFDDPQLIEMRDDCKKFVIDLLTPLMPARWISLLGTSGAGKTMLANLIISAARSFARRHLYLENSYFLRGVRFVFWPDLVERLKDGDYGALKDYYNCWFLLVDDLGVEHSGYSDYVISKLYQLLNKRLGKWTVVTCNLDMPQIAAKMDARIASRLIRNGSQVRTVDVPDYNIR